MTVAKFRLPDAGQGASLAAAFAFFAISTATSWMRWANFEYRTFDLAYYIQALWQVLHGRFEVSVEGVPLLGNHVEPIVFLALPFFALARHPMTLVVLQNALLATMAPVGFQLARLLGMPRRDALWLSLAVLVTPAAGFMALHEFHPETFAAPFLLLLIRARVVGSLRAHWVWFIAVLACKENLSLLLGAYCMVHLVVDRKKSWKELRTWYLWPLALSIIWFVMCTKVITPALNGGTIDYLALYDRLGASAGDIALKAILEPHRIFTALSEALAHGNLLWALLLPFLMLPLFSPRWLLIAAPVLLQHLLSWRSSEWTIYFHYAAPLLPLFWIALVEGLAALNRRPTVPLVLQRGLPLFVLGACLAGQIIVGPAAGIVATAQNWRRATEERSMRADFLRRLPPSASVVAPLPYLSHLAMREKLYSLHYILKGLKTLSRATFEPPPPTDFVLIDYNDSATFDPEAGYYHPTMKTADGRIIPSSDRLLHEFLRRASWSASSVDELTLLRQTKAGPAMSPSDLSAKPILQVGPGNILTSIAKSSDELTAQGLELRLTWIFQDPRDVFPWMFLKLTSRRDRGVIIISKGLCAPEAPAGPSEESWHLGFGQIPEGLYGVEAYFVDNAKRTWVTGSAQPATQIPILGPAISLGDLTVLGRRAPAGK